MSDMVQDVKPGINLVESDDKMWRFEMVIPRDEPMQMINIMDALYQEYEMNPTKEVWDLIDTLENQPNDGVVNHE